MFVLMRRTSSAEARMQHHPFLSMRRDLDSNQGTCRLARLVSEKTECESGI